MYKEENRHLRAEHEAEVTELNDMMESMDGIISGLSNGLRAAADDAQHNYDVAESAIFELRQKAEENARLTNALLEVEQSLREERERQSFQPSMRRAKNNLGVTRDDPPTSTTNDLSYQYTSSESMGSPPRFARYEWFDRMDGRGADKVCMGPGSGSELYDLD